MYKHKVTTLKNGLRLITIPMPQVESATVMIGVGAGSRYETKRVNGLFHFIEHMSFKGTKKRPSTLAIASELDGVGGEFNAFTDREVTGYYIKLGIKHQKLALDILSDMMLNSLFKKEEIEREKKVIIEEINWYEDLPTRRVIELFERMVYGNNSLGWSVAGDKKSVSKIKRNDFFAYLEKLYYPKNMAVSVAGKISQDKIKKLMEKYLGKIDKSGRKTTKKIKIDQKKPKLKLFNKKTDQAHFCLGVPGYWYSHPDRFSLSVLAAILGGGMSSRMWIQVRERRGLGYDVSSIPDFNTDCGLFLTRAGVKLARLEEAIKVVLEEYRKISTQLVDKKELTRAKEMLKGRFVLSLEDSKNVAERYLIQALLEKKIRTPEKAMRLIDKVTPEDVQRVAKDIFKPKNLNLAIVGPYKDESRFRKLLK